MKRLGRDLAGTSHFVLRGEVVGDYLLERRLKGEARVTSICRRLHDLVVQLEIVRHFDATEANH